MLRTWLLPSLRSNVSGSILHVEASRRGRVRLNPSCFSGSGADRRGERRKCRPWRFAPLRQPLDLLNLPIKPRLLTTLSQERVIGLRVRAPRHQRQLSLEVPAERSDVIRSGRTCGRLRLAAKSITTSCWGPRARQPLSGLHLPSVLGNGWAREKTRSGGYLEPFGPACKLSCAAISPPRASNALL